jgi:hypothetical protein
MPIASPPSCRGNPAHLMYSPDFRNWIPDCSSFRGANNKMPLLNVVVILIIVGVGLHLINRYLPMASSIKTILNVVVVVVVCVWLLQATGMWGSVTNFRLRR